MGKVRGFLAREKIATLLLVLSVALTLAAYGRVLSFPFMFDDLIHLRWLQGRGVFEGWGFAKGLQHYRPLVVSLWAASGRLFGAHNPWPLHLLSLLLHVGNACLVGWLAYRVVPGPRAAIAATALFATFPFSYQAIPSPGSQSKPVSTFLILLACFLYWKGRSRRRRALVVATGVPALLAPFAYEAAVTVGGYILLMEYLLWRRNHVDSPSPWSFLFILIGPLFAGIRALVPCSADPVVFPGWEALWQNSVYFAQALTWPMSLLAKPLMRWTGLHDQTATALVAYPSLAILGLLFLWRRRADALLAAISVFCLGLVVQWVILPFGYVIDGPRMLYAASVGVALLWAGLLTVPPSSQHSAAGRVVAALALVAMVAWSLGFIGQRIRLCDVGLAVLSEASTKVVEAEEVQLFINVPSWLAPRERGFALGHEGYLLLPMYTGTGLDDFVRGNIGVNRDVWVESLPDIRREWKALIGYHASASTMEALADRIRRAGCVWVLAYAEDSLHVVEAGSVTTQPTPEESHEPSALAIYADAVALDEIDSRVEGSELTLDLHWRSVQVLGGPYTIFVHLYASDGRLLAQADGLPLGGTFPLRLWECGDMVRDVRHIELPEGLDPSECSIGVGLYLSDTGERAPASDWQGEALSDGMFRHKVRLR